MKLSKSLVITGLLFSSVLGSVNVNSIVANASDNTDVQETRDFHLDKIPENGSMIHIDSSGHVSENKNVTINYIVKGNKATQDITLVAKTVVDKNARSVDKSQLKIDTTKYDFIDATDKYLITNSAITVNLKEKGTTIPEPSKKPTKPAKPSRFVVQQVRISFINKTTGEEVGFQQLVGKDTFSTKIEAPKNYTFVNASDATLKFDKKGSKKIKVYVKQATPQITKHEGVVTTIDGHYKRLYNLEGQVIKSRALSANSAWYTDQFATINGETMYRVATNEWVKASDIK